MCDEAQGLTCTDFYNTADYMYSGHAKCKPKADCAKKGSSFDENVCWGAAYTGGACILDADCKPQGTKDFSCG